MTKFNNSNCDKTQNFKLLQFKFRQVKNSKCEKVQKINMWQNSNTQNVTNFKSFKTWQKLKDLLNKSKRDKTQNWNCDKTPILTNSTTQIVAKLKLWSNLKTQILNIQKF